MPRSPSAPPGARPRHLLCRVPIAKGPSTALAGRNGVSRSAFAKISGLLPRGFPLRGPLLFAPLRMCPSLRSSPPAPPKVFGYLNFSEQAKIDRDFLAVPDVKLAQEELKTLTIAPHVAGSKEDYTTALYVAGQIQGCRTGDPNR